MISNIFVTDADAEDFLPACCLSGARFLMTAVHLAGHLIHLAGHLIHLAGHLIHLKGHQPLTQLAHFAQHLERHNVHQIPPPLPMQEFKTDIL